MIFAIFYKNYHFLKNAHTSTLSILTHIFTFVITVKLQKYALKLHFFGKVAILYMKMKIAFLPKLQKNKIKKMQKCLTFQGFWRFFGLFFCDQKKYFCVFYFFFTIGNQKFSSQKSQKIVLTF